MSNFVEELRHVINKCSMENSSNTPDFLLAQYLIGCMENFAKTVKRRDEWYGYNTDIVSRTSDSELIHSDEKKGKIKYYDNQGIPLTKDKLLEVLLPWMAENEIESVNPLISKKVKVEDVPGEGQTLILRELYNPAILRTIEGNEFSICMRDDTFEMSVVGSEKVYRANIEDGSITEL